MRVGFNDISSFDMFLYKYLLLYKFVPLLIPLDDKFIDINLL